jgi:hypothetical protein
MIVTYTLTSSSDNLITGKIYNFRTRAKNNKGFSDYSNVLKAAAISPPSKPLTPSVDWERTTET